MWKALSGILTLCSNHNNILHAIHMILSLSQARILHFGSMFKKNLDPAISTQFPMDYLEKVKTVHSKGGFGSLG